MLKRNEDKMKKDEDSISALILQDAMNLSADLDEEEQEGSIGHEDQDLLRPKQERRAKKTITKNKVIRQSKRINLKRNYNEMLHLKY
jgi:hypothetical protein